MRASGMLFRLSRTRSWIWVTVRLRLSFRTQVVVPLVTSPEAPPPKPSPAVEPIWVKTMAVSGCCLSSRVTCCETRSMSSVVEPGGPCRLI